MRCRCLEHFFRQSGPGLPCRNAHFNKFRGDGPGSRNDASSHFLTVGTRGGNSAACGFEGLYMGLSPGVPGATVATSRRHAMTTAEPEFFRKPTPAWSVVSRYVPHTRRYSMPNPNQNPGQQNQNPGQKPGQQQQGGGQKPGQQQQDPNRQGQNPDPQRDR